MRRTAVTVATAFVLLVLTAAPASAHTVAGVTATNYEPRLGAMRPAVPGLSLKPIENGSRLELTDTTGKDVIVLGYVGEPYLRVGPTGVYENRRSPATYANVSRKGGAVPEAVAEAIDADPNIAPQWRKVSDGTTARWHDHRAHWMGGQDPPIVKRAPGDEHVVLRDTVRLRMGSTAIAVPISLVWVPGPSPVPWVALALVLGAVVVALAMSSRWALGTAAVLVVVVIADVLHAFGIAWESAGGLGTHLGKLVSGSFFSIVAWIVAAWAVTWLLKRRSDGLFGAIFVGLVVALFGGLTDLSDWWRSQIPYAWGDALARVLIAVSVGAGLGLVMGGVLALRRNAPVAAGAGTGAPAAGDAGPTRTPAAAP